MPPKTRINDKGYVQEHLPGHPMDPGGRQGGWVLQHRRVLYDHLGPEDQPCYWCGHVIPWRDAGGFRHCVNVDHLNEDRTDNRVTNLVPSCWWCNANRSWSRVAPTLWARARRELTDVPPNERQSGILWLAEQAEQAVRKSNTGRAVLGGHAVKPTSPIDRLAAAFPGSEVFAR